MIRRKKPSALQFGALALLALVLLRPDPAISQMQGGPSYVEYQQLLDRVDALETQLKEVEQGTECAFPYQMTSAGIFRMKPQCSTSSSCSPPFSMDDRGIKKVDVDCPKAEEVSSCNPPYRIDENGNKAFRPECL